MPSLPGGLLKVSRNCDQNESFLLHVASARCFAMAMRRVADVESRLPMSSLRQLVVMFTFSFIHFSAVEIFHSEFSLMLTSKMGTLQRSLRLLLLVLWPVLALYWQDPGVEVGEQQLFLIWPSTEAKGRHPDTHSLGWGSNHHLRGMAGLLG